MAQARKHSAPPADVVPVRTGSGGLPPMPATPPRGGWTPATARAAAADYADRHAAELDEDPGRLAAFALRALFVALPDLHHADVLERLNGRGARP